MSSPQKFGWFTPILIAAVGGLAFYSMTRCPGSCTASASRPESVNTAHVPSSAATDSQLDVLIHADENSFDDAITADGPVLVDFYADWCGPCQQLAPVLERVAKDVTRGRIVKVNVDDNPQLAARFDVEALPTLLVIIDGQVVERTLGLQSESDVRRLLQM